MFVIAAAGLWIGDASIGPDEVLAGLRAGPGGDQMPAAVVWDLRLPRTLGAILVGAALAAAAVGLRGVYRNPIADPYLFGISAAAGLGVVVGSLLTPAGASPTTIAALGAALGATLALGTRRLAAMTGHGDRFVLVGLALGLTFLAWTVIVIYAADSPRLPTFSYFVFGGLGAATWGDVLVVLPLVAVGIGVIGARARALDLLWLGDAQARSLGVDVKGTANSVLLAVGAMTGATVAIAGVIGFVGLLSSIVTVRLFGAASRRLLVGGPLIGALLLLGCDLVVRGAPGLVEVPVGIVTASLGGMALVAIVLRARSW